MPQHELKAVTRDDVISLLSSRMTTPAGDEDVTFDMTLILALAGLLFNIIQKCLAAQIMRKHAAVQRKPDGGVARRMKEQIGDVYLEQHPDADYDEVQAHVTASIKSFARSSREEVEALVTQVKSLPENEVDFGSFDDWTIGTLVESLSNDRGME